MKLEKFVWTGVAVGVALCIGTAPISAKPGSVKPSSPKTTTHVAAPKAPTTHGASATTKTTTTHVASPKVQSTSHGSSATHGPKTTTKVSTKSAAATTKTHGNPHATTTTTTTTTKTTTTTGGTSGTTSNTGTTATTAPLSKAQQKLTTNTKLATKMEQRMGTALPDGVTVVQAASGFKNLGQFVAAVNVSNNLGIDFAELKSRMTGLTVDGKPVTTTGGTTGGTTETKLMSLGQAIQDVKGIDSTTATQTANTATTQANAEIASTSTTTTTTTTTTSTTKSKTNTKKH